MTYYYFVASLPHLAFGLAPPLALEVFRARAAEALSPAEGAELGALLAGERAAVRDPVAGRYLDFDAGLRNVLARRRAARHGADPAAHLRGEEAFDAWLLEAVDDAYEKTHPLEREQELDRLRWRTLDDLLIGHYFDLAAVLAYGVKLQLLERWHRLSEAAGRERLNGLLGACQTCGVPI